jgi:hypothetical protein
VDTNNPRNIKFVNEFLLFVSIIIKYNKFNSAINYSIYKNDNTAKNADFFNIYDVTSTSIHLVR